MNGRLANSHGSLSTPIGSNIGTNISAPNEEFYEKTSKTEKLESNSKKAYYSQPTTLGKKFISMFA